MRRRQSHLPQLLFLLVWSLGGSLSAADATLPNVLLILGDDQAWTDFGFMGHPVIQTPHFDKLAKESATFTRGYVPTSLCRPSLATLLTGRYPHEHRICGNDPPKGQPRDVLLHHVRRLPTLPKWLGKQGYASFQTGKWWEGAPAEGGFTMAMSHGDPTRGGRHGDVGLKISREGHEPIVKFLDQVGKQPWFLWHAPFLPHSPHNPPERLLKKYTSDDRPFRVARYYAMCEWFDETLGDLLKILDDRGLAENTLIVFATDNGWIQDPDRDNFAPKSKRSPYDGGLRTPIIVRWPAKVTPRFYDTPVSTVDVVPTILAACGITPEDPLPGKNLLDIAAADGACDRDALFGAIFEHDIVDVDDPAKSLLDRWMLADGEWKLIQPASSHRPIELYNVLQDPHETKNLANEQPERVATLRQRLDTWWPGK
jgi:arylsulfatase A-like enzyme